MSKLSSNWRLTFDPAGAARVLLDYGDWLAGEVEWTLKKPLEVVNLPDSEEPFLRHYGNATYEIRFELSSEASSDTLARAQVLDGLVAMMALGNKPLRVQIPGAVNFWQFASCYVTAPTLSRDETGATPRALRSYAITATGLTKN